MEEQEASRPRPRRRAVLKGLAGAALGPAVGSQEGDSAPPGKAERAGEAVSFRSAWPEHGTRVWAGPDYWANRLQDWRVHAGRLECLQDGAAWPMRTLHLLTRRVGPDTGDWSLSARAGLMASRTAEGEPVAPDAAAGFLIGAGGPGMEYRAAALIHQLPGPGGGLFAGVRPDGTVFFRDFTAPRRGAGAAAPEASPPGPAGEQGARGPDVQCILRLRARREAGGWTLVLSAHDPVSGLVKGEAALRGVPAEKIQGGLALVSHPGTGRNGARFWFRDWEVAGSGLERHPERAWGPILCTLYTLHGGTLKLTAQMAPVGAADSRTAELQVRQGREWGTVATAELQVPGYTFSFRVEGWEAKRDVWFRVRYRLTTPDGNEAFVTREGTIRRDPVRKETIVVASLSCVQQINGNLGGGAGGAAGPAMYRWTDRVWFPHHDLVPNLAKHRPDLYFFAGDQLYEGNPTRPVRQPVEEAELDYLYKWYLWCWSFGELVRDTPCICIPDDHDVYQGNIWGMGGKPALGDDPTGRSGGFGMPPGWVNMIQRTQTSHLPDPHDPAPAAQGIGVYYTTLTWGEIGFAILEDRKFKSSPTIVRAEKTQDNHIIEKGYDTRKADLPGAELLGERQLRFLREFAGDWRGQVMKAALSQTIFCNLQISSRGVTAGELDRDLDSNGWPQSGRNAALREMRRGFMLHLAGDQHLASALQHGIDDWEDAGWSLCSPAISNLYVRFWNPAYGPEGKARPGVPYTGRYEDGFHNRMTVHAVANPVEDPKPGQFPEPAELHRKAPGYAIVRFDKSRRRITLEVWPRYVDPTDPKTGAQYPGWPITIAQDECYGRAAAAWLPALRIRGARDPVVQVIDEADREVVYTLRVRGAEFRPKVFRPGTYTLVVSDPDAGKTETLSGIRAEPEAGERTLTVRF